MSVVGSHLLVPGIIPASSASSLIPCGRTFPRSGAYPIGPGPSRVLRGSQPLVTPKQPQEHAKIGNLGVVPNLASRICLRALRSELGAAFSASSPRPHGLREEWLLGKGVKKWQSGPMTLPAGKGDAVAAGAGTVLTAAGVTGVVYGGTDKETKVKRY